MEKKEKTVEQDVKCDPTAGIPSLRHPNKDILILKNYDELGIGGVKITPDEEKQLKTKMEKN